MTDARAMDKGMDGEIPGSVDRGSCLVTRVVIRNYKSIAACDVQLGPLSFLVGPNGSGKSNFLDAIAFVAESLRHSIQAALDRRHGYYSVCREFGTRAEEFGIRLECEISDFTAYYSLTVRSDRQGVRINRESCRVFGRGSPADVYFYIVECGTVVASSIEHPPAAYSDRLYLVPASGSKGFRSVFDALSNIHVYKISPDSMRAIGNHDGRDVLRSDGANIASVIYNMQENEPDSKALVDQYMQNVVPGIKEVKSVRFPGDLKTFILLFSELLPDDTLQTFTVNQMSNGTLHALGILTLLLQDRQRNGLHAPFIAIEDPDRGMHVDALGALLESIRYASESSQIVVSSQSTDLLDHKKVSAESILAVSKTDQGTQIGAIDEAGRSAIKERLFTAGELLRANALKLPCDLNPASPDAIDLFVGME